MTNVLISACLMGAPVRYDGKGKPLDGEVLVAAALVACDDAEFRAERIFQDPETDMSARPRRGPR